MTKPKTNRDVINAMTDEELATCFGIPCPPKIKKNCRPFNEQCEECWLEWLKSPAGEHQEV